MIQMMAVRRDIMAVFKKTAINEIPIVIHSKMLRHLSIFSMGVIVIVFVILE